MVATLGVFTWAHDSEAAQSDVLMRPDAEASIRLTSINSNWDGLGWQPVLVRIENNADRAGRWEISFETGNLYNRGAKVRTPAVFNVPARSTSESVVFVAGPGKSADAYSRTSGVRVRVDGPGVVGSHVSGFTTSRDLDFFQIATSPRKEEAVRRLVMAATSGGAPRPPFEIEVVDPARWPADWRVWSSFSHIVLGREDHDALDGARRNALREWVAQGGVLWLIPSGGHGANTDVAEVQPFGVGRIHTTLDSLLPSARSGPNLRVTPWKSVAALITKEDREDWALERPLVGLVIFLVIFGIVVGPVNVFVFAPASRRHRLFLTVPALSLGASLLLGVVIVMNDGFGGEGVRRSLVVLLPGENKAAVFQQQVARTGVLVNKEFALPADTLISVGVESVSGASTGVQEAREFDRAGDQADGAWFTSRATQSHDLRRITPTRARIERVDGGGTDGDAPVVQSSVTTVLRDFRYVDAAGKRWVADELPPGKRVTLSPTRTVDHGDTPGYFRAYGGATDLAPLNTHAAITWSDETIIYTGRVEAARQP
jgi:hypothetical protein